MPIDLDRLRVEALPTERTDPAHDLLHDLGGGMSLRLVTATEAGPAAPPSDARDLAVGPLVRIALAATVRTELEGVEVRPRRVGEHRYVTAALDGSAYVSALLADPGPTLGLDGVTDVLVAAPRRSLVVCRPMERAYLGPVVHLDRLSRTLHDDAPDPCTPHVYWWREGALHRIVVDYQRRDVAFPPEVAGLVGALPTQV